MKKKFYLLVLLYISVGFIALPSKICAQDPDGFDVTDVTGTLPSDDDDQGDPSLDAAIEETAAATTSGSDGTDDNPTGVTGIFNGNVTTAGSYDPKTGNSVRTVDDIVMPGSVGSHPFVWRRYFNSRDSNGKWTFP